MSDRASVAGPAASRPRVPIRLKAIALFFLVAVAPVAVVSVWLTGLYRGAIETTEKQLQTAVLSELSSLALRRTDDVQADVEAIASALAMAAASPSEKLDALAVVRSLMATRRSIQAARFEVPAANVSTVLAKVGVSNQEVPESSQQLRTQADDRGVAFQVLSSRVGLCVVPIPSAAADAPRGYVSARIDLGPLVEALHSAAETRFDGGQARLLVVDDQRRVVASAGVGNLPLGSDAGRLAIWNAIPSGTPWSRRVAMVTELTMDGQAMVGGVETVPGLGWATAVWRPRAAAYASLSALTPKFAVAAGSTLFLALLVGVVAAGAIVAPILELSRKAKLIGERRWDAVGPAPKRSDELGELSRSMTDMARSLESSEATIEREARLRGDLSRFMSRELVEAIVKGEHPLELGGSRAEITVLFADVVAFTPLAENRPAEQVVTLLNELFSILSEIVFRKKGVVDKFIGDCLMAVWGVPVAEPDHAALAVAAADEMIRFLEVAGEDWQKRYDVDLRLAIGVNSGPVIVGNIGSDKRMEYTVVGDTVNVAARLESIAKPNQVLLGQATRAKLSEGFEFRDLGEHPLTGRKALTQVYELVVD